MSDLSRTLRSVSRASYRAARAANDLSALTSGDSRRIARRARNKVVGRALARTGFWRAFWGGGR